MSQAQDCCQVGLALRVPSPSVLSPTGHCYPEPIHPMRQHSTEEGVRPLVLGGPGPPMGPEAVLGISQLGPCLQGPFPPCPQQEPVAASLTINP